MFFLAGFFDDGQFNQMARHSSERDRPYDATDPADLGSLLSSLFSLRGYGKANANRQLQEIWNDAADINVAAVTTVLGLKNGVLQIAVANAALRSELANFRKAELLEKLHQSPSGHRIRDLKFLLRGGLKSR